MDENKQNSYSDPYTAPGQQSQTSQYEGQGQQPYGYSTSQGNQSYQPYGNGGQQNSQPYGYAGSQQPQQPKKGSGCAIASLVLGILSLILCCVGGGIFGIIGVVLGIISLCRKESGRGMAIGGLVTSGIGLLLGIFMLIEILAVVAGLGNLSNQDWQDIRDAVYEELEKEGYDIPEDLRPEQQNDFAGEAYQAGDGSVIYFSEDGTTFCWYQDDSNHDRNYYTGTYEVRMGDEAAAYITEDLSELGVEKEELENYLTSVPGDEEKRRENLCCLSLHSESLVGEDGEINSEFEEHDSNYMGQYEDDCFDGVRMETAERAAFTQMD